ncbi:hypothetical protein L7F22_005603 [Adiantum nelumboides]|nr:hypothetical protein [Adiantum nelumboides]
MHADVQHWCRSCHNCQVNGNKRLLYGPRQAVIANGPFEKWGIDAMGPLPRTANGKLYILVAIDYMTRWVEAQSVAKVNEKTVSKFVYTHICCRFGTPLEIVSDNGPGFRRGLLTEVCEELKISHRHSTPYYPQSNGLVEKANGIIARIIRKMVESKPKRWDNFLDGAIWAYRTTYRDATQFTPFHLVYGQEAVQPIELNIPTIKLTGRQEQSNDEAWIDRLLNLVELEWKREAAYHCYKKKALQLKDKLNEGIKDKEIKGKSLVLRYNNALDNRFDAKFERRWEGPFIVKKAFTGGYYQLMDLNGKEHPRKINGYRLKPYLSRILPAVFETKQVSKKTKKDHEDDDDDNDKNDAPELEEAHDADGNSPGNPVNGTSKQSRSEKKSKKAMQKLGMKLVTAYEANEDEEVNDEAGIEPKDIELVMTQAGVSRSKAVTTLHNAKGDIVSAIVEWPDRALGAWWERALGGCSRSVAMVKLPSCEFGKLRTSLQMRCGSAQDFDMGEKIYDDIVSQGFFQKDDVLGIALVDMYARKPWPKKL